MIMNINNIKAVYSSGICSGCGACIVACPKDCITMNEDDVNTPAVDESLCIKCKLCVNVCPSIEYKTYTKQKNNSINNIVGSVDHCVTCHSTDSLIRNKAASGGFITTTAIYLLKKNLVDGIICIKQNDKNPLNNTAFIAKNREEIIAASASRYSSVSTCLPLKGLLKDQGKYAFVGKPCDIQGLRNLQSVFPILKKNIFITIGLFCHHTPSREAIHTILNSYGVKQEEITSIEFRGNGWPGNFEIASGNQLKVSMSYFDAWNKYFSNLKYIPARCLLCSDVIAKEADFSVGDPWGEEFKQDQFGNSVVVIRNDIASQLYNRLLNEKYLVGKDVSIRDLERYQYNLFKKRETAPIWGRAYKNLQTGAVRSFILSLLDKQITLKQKLSILKKMAILYKKVGEL